MLTIPKLDSTLFDWSTWRSGSIHDLEIQSCRYALITSDHGKQQLRKYAIGWCYGENLMCRPKANELAVMFEKGQLRFWFHLRSKEFFEVFGDSYRELIELMRNRKVEEWLGI